MTPNRLSPPNIWAPIAKQKAYPGAPQPAPRLSALRDQRTGVEDLGAGHNATLAMPLNQNECTQLLGFASQARARANFIHGRTNQKLDKAARWIAGHNKRGNLIARYNAMDPVRSF